MKKILSILMVLVLVFSFVGCAKEENNAPVEKTKVNVFGIAGPTGIGMADLMNKAKNNQTELDYNFNIVGSNEEIVAKISNGEADIAAVATNLASVLNSKTSGKVQVLAINTLGVLSVVSKGENISKISDLKGKTVYTTGQGANPEYIITNILEKNNLKVGTDVKLEFVTEPTELVTKVVTNQKAIVIAPQPVATTITVKDANAKIVIDINDEWDKITDTKLVMGCVIARKEFVKKNPKAVETFLKEYKASINATNNDTENVAKLCEEYKLAASVGIAKKAIPHCHIVFQSGKEMKTNLKAYLEFLHSKNPASVGGKLPNESFYY